MPNAPFTIRPLDRTPPGLARNERAFVVNETGKTVAVRVRRQEAGVEGFISIETSCREIDEQGDTVLNEGVEVRCPPTVKTVNAEIFSEGLSTVEDEIAALTADAVRRMNNHAAALEAWRRIPTA